MFHSRSWPVTSAWVPEQPARGLAHRGERLGEQFVERVAEQVPEIGLEPTLAVGAGELVVDGLPVGGVGRRALLLLERGDLRAERRRTLGDDGPELRGLRAQLLLAHRRQARAVHLDLGEDRPNSLQFPFMP